MNEKSVQRTTADKSVFVSASQINMNPSEKVQILLKEYDTLRAEILQRIGHRFAYLGLTGALGAYAFFVVEQLTPSQAVVLMVSGVIASWTWFQQGNIIARCSERIAEIEKAINSLAGEPLLTWETEQRGSKGFHKVHGSEINKKIKIYPLVVRVGAKLLRVRQWRRFRDVLTRCAERTTDFFFIEIGANDGVTQDILHQYIDKNRWRGILVEPVPYYFEKLKRTYEANDQLVLENVAISDKEEIRDFYRVRESVNHFPYWSEGLASFDLNVVLSHWWAMPDISDYIVTEKVKCIPFRSLLQKHNVKKIDLLSIDTEGYDYEIIKQIDFDNLSPVVLIYEHKHLKRDERKRCESMLRAHRYALRKQRGNTLAYLREAMS